MAISVLERGYYQQTLGLVRMAMEDMLVVEDIEINPATLQALLFDEGKLGTGELRYSEMAHRISPKAGSAWKNIYGEVSQYGAHPRMKALESSVVWDKSETPHLSLPSFYDKGWVAACTVMTAKQAINLVGTVVRLLQGTESEWASRAYQSYTALEELIDETREIAGPH